MGRPNAHAALWLEDHSTRFAAASLIVTIMTPPSQTVLWSHSNRGAAAGDRSTYSS